MSTLGDNLKAIRKAKSMTQKQLASKAGIKQSVISELETGVAKSTGSILELAKALGVSAEELKTGTPSLSNNSFSNNLSSITRKMAPVLSWVQAGNWTNVQSIEKSLIEEWLPLPDDDCDDCYYLKVQGLSNFPDFHEGDYILVDPNVCYSDMCSGDMIVVRKGTDVTFKKLVIEPDDSRYLKALNPDFQPNIIPLCEECVFVGQVIDSVRYVYKARKRIRRI